MDRRKFLRTTGIAVGGTTVLAGCTSETGDDSPPPRKSNIFQSISFTGDGIRAETEPQNEQWVMSRRRLPRVTPIGDSPQTQNSSSSSGPTGTASPASTPSVMDVSQSVRDLLSQLSPVGVAAAKGRGSTGRGTGTSFSSAPKTTKGRGWYLGGGYAAGWYASHDDEVDKFPVQTSELAAAYLGTDAEFQNNAPGPGPVAWDSQNSVPFDDRKRDASTLSLTVPVKNTRESDSDSEIITVSNPGWYRVGANIVSPDTVTDDNPQTAGYENLGWESVDLKLDIRSDGVGIVEQWKVSPRI